MVKIGLEIHGYLKTKEKLFCSCNSTHGSKISKPNTNICPICTGQPGAKLMLPNKKAIRKGIQIALILGCKINPKVAWQRKHYSWPDLPKGYQNTISGSHVIPFCENGNFQNIKITEAHLEEDPAAWNPKTGEIDYNKSGYPLIEIVTEPDFINSKQVIRWMKQLVETLTYMKIIDRTLGVKADVNVSIPELKGERVEIKNINSLKNIERAIEYEISRQSKPGELAKKLETRMFDEISGKTMKMRDKELAEDYRFISEPDLPVLKVDKKEIDKEKKSLPERPQEKIKGIIKKHKIEKKHAEILTTNLDLVEFFEQIIKKVEPKLASRWVTGELLRVLNYSKKELHEVSIQTNHFIELLKLIERKTITELKAKEILNEFIPKSFSPKEKAKSSKKISSKSEIKKIAKEVIRKNPKAAEDYKQGKKESINFLIGQVMKISNKRADFKVAKEIIEKEINRD
ncbi:MAG: Asp-tRNA(Asn)/Glu-tRNA(Gln) amidotransferase subunit GatB [Candidatus Pacearchaeota archaeon]